MQLLNSASAQQRHFRLRWFSALRLATLAATVFCLFGSPAEAAHVGIVKGKQLLIIADGLDMQVGQKFFVVVDGKKTAVVQITQVGNGKALGRITKGHAEVNSLVEPAAGAGKKAAKSDEGDQPPADGSSQAATETGTDGTANEEMILKKKEEKKSGGGKFSAGALLGYGMDSQTLNDPSGNGLTMSGSGFSVKGFGDYNFIPRVGIIGRLGIEQFNLNGSTAAGSYNTSIMYLTTDALLHFNFTTGKFVPFAAGGFGIHYPLSASSNILNVPQISATTVFFFELGFNLAMGKKSYFTLLGDYGDFPPSNGINTTLIAFRLGMGFRF